MRKLILTPVLGLLLVFLYWGPFRLDNAFGSVSEDEDDAEDDNSETEQQPAPLVNSSTSGGMAALEMMYRICLF